MLASVGNENTEPVELKPNRLTRETMRKTAQGIEVHKAKDVEDLFRKLQDSKQK